MTTSEPTVQVTGPADLIEAVPYLLGFHPTESLVLVGFEAGSQQIVVTARLDLGPAGVDPAQLDSLDRVLTGAGVAAVAAILATERVTGDPRRMSWLAGICAMLVDALSSTGLRLLDVLVATADRWWSLCCDRPACCPPGGTVRDAGNSTVAATATFAGMVALPDRTALAGSLDGASPAVRAALLPALRRADQRLVELARQSGPVRTWRGEQLALIRAAAECEAGLQLSPRRLARLGAALRVPEVRDRIWLAVDAGSLTAGRLLDQLHLRLPPPYQAAPMFLYGWWQWRTGSGTLAAMAAERALRADPGYTAAGLLLDAVQSGMHPRRTPPLMAAAGPGPPERDG